MKKSIINSIVCVFLLAITSCNMAKTGDKSENAMGMLTPGKWIVTTIEGKNIIADDFSRDLPNLTFTVDHKVYGNSGCNNLSGEYTTTTKGSIDLGHLASTRMACPGNGENKFLAAINKVTHFKVKGDKLILLNGTQEVLTFNRN